MDPIYVVCLAILVLADIFLWVFAWKAPKEGRPLRLISPSILTAAIIFGLLLRLVSVYLIKIFIH